MKRIRSSLAICMSILLLTLCAGCKKEQKEASAIPENYKNVVIVNYFTNTWSQSEMGEDLQGSVDLVKGSDDYNVILTYLGSLQTMQTDNSGNFMPDFSLSTGDRSDNTFDFKFYETQLIVRNLNGECFEILLTEETRENLREYIGEIRLSIIEQGNPTEENQPSADELTTEGYPEDRPLTDEDTALFEETMKEVAPENTYNLITVTMQLVEGTNYRYLAKIIAPTESYNAYIYIFVPLPETGEKPIFVSEERI